MKLRIVEQSMRQPSEKRVLKSLRKHSNMILPSLGHIYIEKIKDATSDTKESMTLEAFVFSCLQGAMS